MLPLSTEQNTIFIGEFAVNPRYQGAGSSHINVKSPVSAMECVEEKNVTYVKGYDADWSDNCKKSENIQAMKAGADGVENTGILL